MRVISLHQPWASLIFLPGLAKVHETRAWAYPDKLTGQRIAIHAAARAVQQKEVAPLLECPDFTGHHQIQLGALLGTVRLAGCFRTDDRQPANEIDRLGGDWTPGRFAWALEDARPLATPIKAKGRQGWWTLPDDLFTTETGA